MIRKLYFGIWLLLLMLGVPPVFGDRAELYSAIQSLTGKWEGTYRWTGARSDHGRMSAVYSPTGKGSAIVEDLIVDGETVMTSVYHLDGNDLRMTHYCGAGNQPRLKADSYTDDPLTIKFELIDITNLPKADAPHVSGVELLLQGSDHIVLSFTFVGNGSTSVERIELHRVK